MLSALIFWAAIASIVSAAFFGLVRGLPRAFLRFFTVLVAFIASAFLCSMLTGDPERLLEMSAFRGLIEAAPPVQELLRSAPELAPLAVSLPSAMLAPLIFLLLFLAISGLLLLIYGIAAAFLFPKNGGKGVFATLSHVLGMGVGALQGMLVALALLIPIVGLTDVTVEMIDTVEAEGSDYRVEALEELSSYRDELVKARESRVYRYAERFGGAAICRSLMRYELSDGDGEASVELRQEILVFARLYAHSFPLQSTAPRDFGERQAAALHALSSDLGGSELLPRLMAGLLSCASENWKQGDAFLGIEPFAAEGELSPLPSLLYDALCGVSAETLCSDLETLAELVDILARYGIFEVLSDGEELLARATDPEALSEITLCLDRNPRTAAVADGLAEIALGVFCDTYLPELPETDPDYGAYRELLGRVAEAVNGISPDAPLSEQREALIPALREALLDFGTESDLLSQPLLEAAAEHILGELSGEADGVTADDIGRVLSSIGS